MPRPPLLWLALICAGAASAAAGGRIVVSLDGEWEIADSLAADQTPAAWTHHVPVPGLAHLAQPPFPDVDRFDSKEVLWNRFRKGHIPESEFLANIAGVAHQKRNYFWYRRTFRLPARREAAILRINKAQFGTAVWLNGRKIGEHLGCFTAGYFDLTGAANWSAENTLIVRVGAYPGVLPENFPAGTDFEKNLWTPGIYDDVSLLLSDNPLIRTVQVAPHIQPPEIVVQTVIRNTRSTPVSFRLEQKIRTWKENAAVAASKPEHIRLAAGEERTITQTVAVPGAQLWSPEHPFLYVLDTSTSGDSVSTRFGMREFRYDTATRRAWLNGKVIFLRGSNITLHRFFEDPLSGSLPWNDQWVRKLLIDIPKRMNWNAFRFCIGPVPDHWMDIADEAGLLIQNEFFIWTGHPPKDGPYSRHWDADELIRQYKEWMRDNWNHPSQAVWDATNETFDPVFGEKVIPAVRGLDLSHRPWENSYNGPEGPDDPVEDHPYEFGPGDKNTFDMAQLEKNAGSGAPKETPTGHASILNEYGWLWLLRNGAPTELTAKVYERLLGPNASASERLALDAYLLGGLTEFWRAYRKYAAVLHFVYLTGCYPGAYTCDNFQDPVTLTLDPHFADYMREAFKPLGVYIDFWRPTLTAGEQHQFIVMMVNDESEASSGKLALSIEDERGHSVARTEVPFTVAGLGQQTFFLNLDVPAAQGNFLLKAAAYKNGVSEPTLSRRKVRIVPPKPAKEKK